MAEPMKRFEELDYRPTAKGPAILRRRWVPVLDRHVVEILLGDEHLMSDLFIEGESELARRALALAPDRPLSVLVGGLGLGYTARAALEDPRVTRLTVLDALQPVIEWHEEGLVPLTPPLRDDPRCVLRLADFFTWFSPGSPRHSDETYDLVLLDIDHSPTRLLAPDHAAFYTPKGLADLALGMRPDGVFAMWSDDPAEAGFIHALRGVFADVHAEDVRFDNPLTGEPSQCTLYLGRRR